jgi:hypothetical protein
LPKYTYKVVKSVVEDAYVQNTGKNVYDALGDVDFDNVTLIVEAKNIDEAKSIREGVTDIRMWDLESEV